MKKYTVKQLQRKTKEQLKEMYSKEFGKMMILGNGKEPDKYKYLIACMEELEAQGRLTK